MRYVFADCILDTRLYTLYREGTVIRLRPKVFHVLQYLLEHRDHVVSKDELCAQVWPGQFISNATLEGCITLARRAIGDSGQGQRLIVEPPGLWLSFCGGDTGRGCAATRAARDAGRGRGGPRAGAVTASWYLLPDALIQGVPKGERKLVTLLSCTLVAIPDSQASMDLEDLHGQIRALYALAQREVHQYGGTIQQVAATASWRCLVPHSPRRITLSGPSWPLLDCARVSSHHHLSTAPQRF